jgi:hypothetical protein
MAIPKETIDRIKEGDIITILSSYSIYGAVHKKAYVLPHKYKDINETIRYLKSLFDNCTVYWYNEHMLIVPAIVCHFTLIAETKAHHELHLQYRPSDAFTIVDGKPRTLENVCLICDNYAKHIVGECNKKSTYFKLHNSEKDKHRFKAKRKIKTLFNVHPRYIFDKEETSTEYIDYTYKSIINKMKKYDEKINKHLIEHQTKLDEIKEDMK